MTKLNLGCANDIKQGYINIDLYHKDDRVRIMDVRDLRFFSEGEYDINEIYASDVLEHLEYNEAINALKHWSSLLSPGGKMFIKTINIEEQIRALTENMWSLKTFNAKLFAGRGWIDGVSRDQDFHKCAFTSLIVTQVLENSGMKILSNETEVATQDRPQNINFSIWAQKCE